MFNAFIQDRKWWGAFGANSGQGVFADRNGMGSHKYESMYWQKEKASGLGWGKTDLHTFFW